MNQQHSVISLCLGALALLLIMGFSNVENHPSPSRLSDASITSLSRQGVPIKALKTALKAYHWAKEKNHEINNKRLILVNFTQPSTEHRLYIINLKKKILITSALVAHGQGSGGNYAIRFSDKEQSHESSPGAFIIESPYEGEHGYSIRIKGLEAGINSDAQRRDIVIHQAPYVSEAFIQKVGRLGRSWGCFALNPAHYKKLVRYMTKGTFLFAYTKGEESDPHFSKITLP